MAVRDGRPTTRLAPGSLCVPSPMALRRCGFGFAAAGGAAGAFLFCYGLMTGFGPSVVRAAAMCGLSFLAAFLGRTYDLMSALCIPALALLWSRPCLLTQASFQLSFLAAGAVAFPGGFLIRRFKARQLIPDASCERLYPGGHGSRRPVSLLLSFRYTGSF